MGAYNQHDLLLIIARVSWVGSVLLYEGSAKPLTTACEGLDNLDHDLSDLFELDDLDRDLSDLSDVFAPFHQPQYVHSTSTAPTPWVRQLFLRVMFST